MAEPSQLSRREREIMDILYALGGATTMEVVGAMKDPPTDKAVRRLLHILVEKGHVRRRQRGREVVYVPKQPKKRAGLKALQHVIDTFFEGALDENLEGLDGEVVRFFGGLLKSNRREREPRAIA